MLAPQQVAVGVQGGISILIHGARVLLEHRGDFVIVKIDLQIHPSQSHPPVMSQSMNCVRGPRVEPERVITVSWRRGVRAPVAVLGVNRSVRVCMQLARHASLWQRTRDPTDTILTPSQDPAC